MGGLQAPPGLTLIAPRRTLAGASGEGLSNLIVDNLPDGALCVVTDEQALYRLDKTSLLSPDGALVVVTARGASARGRWVQTGGPETGALETLVWCDAAHEGASTGSIIAPFRTLQEAIDALGAEGGTVLMVPGEYPDPWAIPANRTLNIIGLAGAQGVAGGNISLASGTIAGGSGVRLENISLSADITLSGLGALLCMNVAFAIHDIIQAGAGGWNVRIASDGLDECDVGNVTAGIFFSQNVKLQRPITVRGGTARILTTVAQGDITFEGAAGDLFTDLFSLNQMRAADVVAVNAAQVIALDAPTERFTVTSPVFAGAGSAFVDVEFTGTRVGDTFAITNLTDLPANVFLGQPRVTTPDHCLVCLNAFAAALSGDVDVAITRFAGGA